jgi:hypothetical protein
MAHKTCVNSLMVIGAAAMLSACAHHPSRVDCEGKLEPINIPARVIRETEIRTTPAAIDVAGATPADPAPKEEGKSP